MAIEVIPKAKRIAVENIIKEKINNGETINFSQIGREVDVYYKTVQRIAENAGIEIPENLLINCGRKKKKNIIIATNDKTLVVKEPATSYEDIIVVNKSSKDNFYNWEKYTAPKTVKAVLVADRHAGVWKEYANNPIFGNVPSSIINDFDALENIARAFVNSNLIDEKGHIVGDLEVCLTGLQSCYTALISVCIEFNISLTVALYDAASRSYIKKKLLSFGEQKDDILKRQISAIVAGKNQDLTSVWFDTNDEIVSEFYSVSVEIHNSKLANGELKCKEVYITPCIDRAFSEYSQKSIQLLSGDVKHAGCFINKYSFVDGKFMKNGTVSKTFIGED